MANGVNTKLAAINAALDNIYARLGVMNENQASYADAADTFYANFLTLSGFLQLAIGTFSEAEPGTVLYTLRRIAVCICMLAGGSPPSETAPNGCDEPLAALNERLISVEDHPGVGFVEWDSVLPQGVELDNSVYPELPTGIELHLTGDAIYYLWVQSSCTSFHTVPDGASAFPTNSWVAIDGPNTIAVNLADGCAASAFLCIDPNLGFVDCVQRTSSITETVHATVDNSDRVRLSVPLDGLGLTLTDTINTGGGNSLTSDSGLTFASDNANGYHFEWVSGVRIRVWWQRPDLGFGVQVLDSGTTEYTITKNTGVWGVDNWQEPIGNVSQPFEVIICPPAPG